MPGDYMLLYLVKLTTVLFVCFAIRAHFVIVFLCNFITRGCIG